VRAAPVRRSGDAGSGSILVLSLSAVVALVACVLVALGAVATSRHRAASAADLGALAAAGQALEGEGLACARAARVVLAAGASVVACRVSGDVAEVDVEVRPAGPLGVLGSAHGRAKAGPASSPGVSRPRDSGTAEAEARPAG